MDRGLVRTQRVPRRKPPDFSDFIGLYPPDSPNPRSICFLSDKLLAGVAALHDLADADESVAKPLHRLNGNTANGSDAQTPKVTGLHPADSMRLGLLQEVAMAFLSNQYVMVIDQHG